MTIIDSFMSKQYFNAAAGQTTLGSSARGSMTCNVLILKCSVYGNTEIQVPQNVYASTALFTTG